MKLVIIANPKAGRGRAYRALCRHVRQWPHAGWEVEILPTRAPNHAGELARSLAASPPDLLAVCGGDGTVNEIATAVPQPPFPVAVLPAGTANVLARELRLPLNPVDALKVALDGCVRRIDLGSLGAANGRRFLFVAGVGFDAFVVSQARPAVKARLGIASYIEAIVESLLRYPFPEFLVAAGERAYTATSCLVCNSKRYGGGLLFCPDADMHDGALDLLILEGRRRIALAWFLLMAWMQRPMRGAWIHRIRSGAFRIEGPPEVLVETDGELAGNLPLDFGISHASFPLIFP